MAALPKSPDVRQLGEQDLPSLMFPAPRERDFRIHFAADVHDQIARHARADTSIEICGVLVGRWGRDEDGPFVMISELIRCDSAASKAEQVTFTHEAWAEISREMDTRYVDLSIVGWYHSHPDFGIFLSERDCFIHEHFFAGPGQVAYVIDPVRNTDGVFVWRDGKPVIGSSYWVGDQIYADRDRPGEGPSARSHGAESSAPSSPAVAPAPPEPSSMTVVRLVTLVAVFLIGYLLASLSGEWERQRIIEGTVVHYGLWKGLRPGLKEHLDVVEANLAKVSTSLSRPSKEKVDEWQAIQEQLRRTRELLVSIERTYCLDEGEAMIVARLLAAKLAGAETDAQPVPPDEDSPQGKTAGSQTPPSTGKDEARKTDDEASDSG